MNKTELLKKTGSIQQFSYIRPIEYLEGRSSHMRGFDVKNGCLSFQVLADKCLDVGQLSYKGINMSFISKPGLQGRNHYDTNGDEALRSIMGGMFFTAGLENICPPYQSGGKDYPMHGRIRTTPAEHICSDCFWDKNADGQDVYRMVISGEMREAELFGENMVLRRRIETSTDKKGFILTDEIENQSFRDEPLMLLYHINLGYPFLDEGTKLYATSKGVTARDEDSKGHEDEWDVMDAPKDNEPEYVFIHEPWPDEAGNMCVIAVNEGLELGFMISYNMQNLPYFMEWKSTASGDYVIGLEPANSSVYGRAFHEKEGTLHHLAPFAKEKNVIEFTILDGREEIEGAIKKISR